MTESTLLLIKGPKPANSNDVSMEVPQEVIVDVICTLHAAILSFQASTSSTTAASSNAAPVPCKGGCGFFGNPGTNNYCSKCWKDLKEKEEKEKEDAVGVDT